MPAATLQWKIRLKAEAHLTGPDSPTSGLPTLMVPMSIEPSALQFDPTIFSYNCNSYSLSNELLSTQFPSTFTLNPIPPIADFTQLQPQQWRLSITSSSSSSGASLSPILEPSTAMPEHTYSRTRTPCTPICRGYACSPHAWTRPPTSLPKNSHYQYVLPFYFSHHTYLLHSLTHSFQPYTNPNSQFPAIPALPPLLPPHPPNHPPTPQRHQHHPCHPSSQRQCEWRGWWCWGCVTSHLKMSHTTIKRRYCMNLNARI